MERGPLAFQPMPLLRQGSAMTRSNCISRNSAMARKQLLQTTGISSVQNLTRHPLHGVEQLQPSVVFSPQEQEKLAIRT